MCVKIDECIQITESHESYLEYQTEACQCIFVKHPNYWDRKTVIERESCRDGAVLFWVNFQFCLETPAQSVCINSLQSATEGSKVLAVSVQTEWCKNLSLSPLSCCLSFFDPNHPCGRTNEGSKDWFFFLFLFHPYFSPLWLCFGKVWLPYSTPYWSLLWGLKTCWSVL